MANLGSSRLAKAISSFFYRVRDLSVDFTAFSTRQQQFSPVDPVAGFRPEFMNSIPSCNARSSLLVATTINAKRLCQTEILKSQFIHHEVASILP
jgi:hypothetical protein